MIPPMAEPLRRLAGWLEILASPEGVKAEVIAGELYAQPRPRPAHNRSQVLISARIALPFDLGEGGPGGWWILAEPDVFFGPHDIVSPDLASWRRQRIPGFPPEQPIVVTPDWVCEVISPRTAQRDRTVKADLYLHSGVPNYWLVDLDLRTVEAFTATGGRWLRLGAWCDGDRARIPPFEAIEIEIATLLPPPPQKLGPPTGH